MQNSEFKMQNAEFRIKKLLLIKKNVLPLPPLTSIGLSCGVMVTQQILVLSFWVRVPAAQLTKRGYFGNLFFFCELNNRLKNC